MTGTLTGAICEHVAAFDASTLPREARDGAARALLDGLGVMLAASGMADEVKPFHAYALDQGGTPEATILGFGDRVPAPLAAFVNGAMAHALDFEDTFDAAPVHPNASLLAAALPVLESGGASAGVRRAAASATTSGRELLAAIAIGGDLTCRLAVALRRRMEAGGWYPPPILGAFGATAAVARLMRLTPVQIADAFSLTLCGATMPGELKHAADATIRAVREAFPAQLAVTSCRLAASGVRGFAAPFEGEDGFYRLYANGEYDAPTLTGGLGHEFLAARLTFKRWPSCRGTHAYIEAVRALRAKHAFRVDDVLSIHAEGGSIQRMLAMPAERKRAPATAIDAKFSIPFTIAAALVDGDVTLDTFAAPGLRDARRLEIAARVQFVERRELDGEAAAGDVTLELRDGRRLHESVAQAAGHPGRPLGDAALIEKFVDCTSRAARPLADGAARALAARVLALDGVPDAALSLAAESISP